MQLSCPVGVSRWADGTRLPWRVDSPPVLEFGESLCAATVTNGAGVSRTRRREGSLHPAGERGVGPCAWAPEPQAGLSPH